MKLVHGSLFSGFDAPSVAASWMGWENAFHCEINDFCNTILKYWFPDSEHYEDITRTDFSKWRGRVDVLTGGFPCQPFSVAGQRKGADDNRYLWPHMLRAIQEIRPAWVIGENVAGILTMVQPGEEVEVGSQTSIFGEDNRKRVLLRQEYVVETICKDLEREGYSVQPMLIPACAVGAPHRRDRVWFVARRNDDNCDNGRKDHSGSGGFPIHKPVEMENKQQGLCLSDNTIKERWKEMGDYLDAQVNFMCERGGGNRPCESIKAGQPEAEFTNNIALGESSQPGERFRSEKPERPKQMVCSNLYKREEISFRVFRHKRTSDGGKTGCGEETIAHRTDSRAEDVRREWKDEILSDRTATDTNINRQRLGKNEQKSVTWSEGKTDNCTGSKDRITSHSQCPGSGQIHEKVQSEESDGHCIDCNGSERDVTNPDSKKLQERIETGRRSDKKKDRTRLDDGVERFGSLRYAPYSNQKRFPAFCFPTSIEKKKRENEDGRSLQSTGNDRRTLFSDWWQDFPTQPPVCRGNDGLPFAVDDLAISFTKWRQESVKGYGNAIVPQVIFEIFKAIEKVEHLE